MRRLVIGAIAAVAGCATTPSIVPVQYDVTDLPDRLGVALSYTNRTRQIMCLSPSDWPNGSGWLDSPEDRVFLKVGQRRYSMKPHNTGYCYRGCDTRVRPGETVTDFVPYERFDLPPEVLRQPKQLEFVPPAVGYPCTKP